MSKDFKILLAIIVPILCFLLGAAVVSKEHSPNASLSTFIAPPPVMGWQVAKTESFAMRPQETRTLPFSKAMKLRVRITSASGVDFATLASCDDATAALSIERVCEFENGDSMVLTDSRTVDASAAQMVGAFLHVTKPPDIAPNPVTIELSAWTCIQNCS